MIMIHENYRGTLPLNTHSEPSPNVIDGAKACAVASAAWASSESGTVEKVFNDF